MALDIKRLLRNKKAVAGLAAAGALGLVVALRGKSSGGGSDLPATSAGTGSGGIGTYDSTGMDVANQLGQFGNSINNSLSDFQSSLTDTLTALQNVPTATGGTGSPKPGPTATPKPVKKPPASGGKTPTPRPTPSKPKPYTIRRGDTLSAIAKRNKTTLANLRKLNPGLFNAAHRNGNLIKPGETVRLR